MRYLADTHSLVWFIGGDSKLSAHALELMTDEENDLFVSMASLWEIAIKHSLGKLNLAHPFEAMFPDHLEKNSIEILGIHLNHVKTVCNLPFHHRDPYDRIIIAQSLSENIPVIGIDSEFDKYGVQREW